MPLSPASVGYFVDRENILNELESGLEFPEHYLLLGPRKSGKTSILEAIHRSKKKDSQFIVSNIIHCLGEKNFESVVLKMINELIEKEKEFKILPRNILRLKKLYNKIIKLFSMKTEPYSIEIDNQSVERISTIGVPSIAKIKGEYTIKRNYIEKKVEKDILQLSNEFCRIMNDIYSTTQQRVLFCIDELGYHFEEHSKVDPHEIEKALLFWELIILHHCPHPIVAAASRNPFSFIRYALIEKKMETQTRRPGFNMIQVENFEKVTDTQFEPSDELISKYLLFRKINKDPILIKKLGDLTKGWPFYIAYFFLKVDLPPKITTKNYQALEKEFIERFANSEKEVWKSYLGQDNFIVLSNLSKGHSINISESSELIHNYILKWNQEKGRYTFIDSFLEMIFSEYW